MKNLIFAALTLFSLQALASGTCDLSANDRSVQEVNDTFDRGEMRGEDHAVSLKLLYTERLQMIADCIRQDKTQGMSKEELKDTLVNIQAELDEYLKDMNAAIQNSIENDRIGMATQLMMERDMHLLEEKNVMAKIEDLIKKQPL